MMTTEFKEELRPNILSFRGMVNNIPEKYLFRVYKNQIIENKVICSNRIVEAKVLFKIANREAKKSLVYTNISKP